MVITTTKISQLNLIIFEQPQRSMHPIVHMDLFIDIVRVSLNGVGADAELDGDLMVAQPGGEQREDLSFPHGQRR